MPAASTRAPAVPAPPTRPSRSIPSSGPEVADIFRLHGPAYLQGRSLPLEHHRVMRHIQQCRTSDMGGHIERCEACGFSQSSYNSCGDRHCPKCQSMARANWIEARQAELLPVPYFHLVFTLPHELNRMAEVMENKKPIYNLLFRSVSDTLKAFGENPDNGLGGKIGFTAVLHTWDQKLRTHIHLHCIVPGGALSADKSEWLSLPREDFLFPVPALSKVFQGKFMEGLRRALARGEIHFPPHIARLALPGNLQALVDTLYRKKWGVYAKRPFGGPGKALEYLARYSHRIAISNHRILEVSGGQVTFSWRDREDGNVVKRCTVPAEEFIRRFLLHVLPWGFMRIRHFGLLANRAKTTDLPICRALLGGSPEAPELPPTNVRDTLLRLRGIDITRCPECGLGTMQIIRTFEPIRFSTKTGLSLRAPPC